MNQYAGSSSGSGSGGGGYKQYYQKYMDQYAGHHGGSDYSYEHAGRNASEAAKLKAKEDNEVNSAKQFVPAAYQKYANRDIDTHYEKLRNKTKHAHDAVATLPARARQLQETKTADTSGS